MDYDTVLQQAATCLKGTSIVQMHPMVFKDLWLWVNGFVGNDYLVQYLHLANSDYLSAGLAQCIINWAGGQ